MFRRNPDAVAILAIALFIFALSLPRMIVQRAHWSVTPLKMEMQSQRDQIMAVKDQIRSHEAELKAAAQEIRDAIRH